MSILADFSIYHWSAGIATQAAGTSIIPRATPATTGHWGESQKFNILVGQDCHYTESHWSESEKDKLEIGERKMGSG
jgi:hypothetical protein